MLLVWEPAFENCCFRSLPWALRGCLSNTVLSARNIPKKTLILFGFGPSPSQLPSIPIHFSTPPTFLLPHSPLKVFLLKLKIVNLLTKPRGRVERGEGGGFTWGGVEGWGEKAYNCNCITIKKIKKKNCKPAAKLNGRGHYPLGVSKAVSTARCA